MYKFINKAEILGIVGNASTSRVGDKKVTRMSVATDRCYKNRDGSAVIETTWFQCTAWEKEGLEEAQNVKKGDWVHIKGRFRNIRYSTADGAVQNLFEIQADKLEILDKDDDQQGIDEKIEA